MPWRLALSAWLLLLALSLAGCSRESSTSPPASAARAGTLSDQFLSLMNSGKNYLDQGDGTNALKIYAKAEALVPHNTDVRLNMANSYLLANEPDQAIRECDEALKLEPNSAAAYFIKGAGWLRLSNFEEAAKALENTKKIEPGETAALFQLGVARMGLKQWDNAVAAFQEGIRLDPNHLHSAAHYLLALSLRHAGRDSEAKLELEQHPNDFDGTGLRTGTFEKSKFTRARIPFKLEQPDKAGVAVKFIDATRDVFGLEAAQFTGPVAVIDANHSGWNDLFVIEKNRGFRLVKNTNGVFNQIGPLFPLAPGVLYSKMLVGDLQNDRFDDVIALGNKGSRLFRFGINNAISDVSNATILNNLSATDGALIDLDFTGKLDLIAITAATNDVRIYRQFGPLHFSDITATSGVPSTLKNARNVLMEDWNRDENMDLIVSRNEGAPTLLEKQRGGALIQREPADWPTGAIFCAGDFDNDLRPDLAIVSGGKIIIVSNDGHRSEIALPANRGSVQQILTVDYDNDGWLDLCLIGERIQMWRNSGLSGFQDRTTQLGLDQFKSGPVSEIHFADFDRDCDTDAIVVLASGGLRYLRNDGGNANSQVKVQLVGNRSNASGIGCKIEIETGGLRLLRTVRSLPVELGVGKYQKLDSFLVHWFNWAQGSAEVPVNCREPLLALELTIQEGSCPYLFAWDGSGFRFVTDILGAAPLGLPIAKGRNIEADPEEIVWIGNEQNFKPKDGSYQLQVTEELREALYLDDAKLVVADHEPGTEVQSTDKLLPGKPFPKGTIMTLHSEHPLRKAETLTGRDVTSELAVADGRRVSPPALRGPHLRGLAEPHGLILDFGPLKTGAPLVLVLNGWIRFGGGMANIAASEDPSFPFPFPSLEAETSPGQWSALDIVVGAPAGKTKTILVDLEKKLPAGARRLRLAEAFEIHWDRIALMEKQPQARTQIAFIPPAQADLHFRGFSRLKDLPSDWPLTPDYDVCSPNSYWTIAPGGWCTRYGDVLELCASRDEGLAVINSGDELTLRFDIRSLPPKPPGMVREFFLYADGWDKDSDFHVAKGTSVEPLPFHGMDDQAYGLENRPTFPSDALHRRFNTRWVEGSLLKQNVARSRIQP
jgi:tetratricopeptide (TPR) repeat protein